MPLRLTAETPETYAAIENFLGGFGTATLVFSNKDSNDIMEKIKSLKESGLLIEGVSETIQNEAKEQESGFLTMWLGTLDVSLLGNVLGGKGVIPTRAGKGTIRAGQDF